MKKIILLSFILLSHLTFSQDWDFEKPDYKKIEMNIKKKSSNLFYSTLMDRYLNADSTMTLEEKRHLYYGYTFDEKYSPYSPSPYGDSLRIVLQKEELDSSDLINMVAFTDKMLLDNPFDLNALNYQLYSFQQMGDKQSFDNKVTQLRIIVEALMSSGNGTRKEDAFYVIYTAHEYDILDILGFQFGGSQSLIGHYDYLTVAENEINLDGLFFDITPCLNSLSLRVKD